MNDLLKRSALVVSCCALAASVVLAQDPPAKPSMPSGDGIKDKAKDAANDAKKAVEDAKKKAEEALKGAGGQGMPDEKMMEEMMKGMQPGPMHEWLKKWEGNWDMVVKAYWSPGAPPEENKMSATSSFIMGGRYLIEKVSGEIEMPGAGKVPFEGVSTMGYDNMQKKFFSTWYDSMSTGIMFETGTVDGAGKVLTMEGENWNPALGAMAKSKSVVTVVDEKTRMMEMWSAGPDGKMTKSMEITYTRKN